jgi:hypothetical protein
VFWKGPMKKGPGWQFDTPRLSRREAAVLRSALIKYAAECDARFQEADSPQDAYTAATDAEAARSLAVRVVKVEAAPSRAPQSPGLRHIR